MSMQAVYEFIIYSKWLLKAQLALDVVVVSAPNLVTRELILEDFLNSPYKEFCRWEYLGKTKMVFYPYDVM